jgi:hypothetical protein
VELVHLNKKVHSMDSGRRPGMPYDNN